jgi:hypothetical protein
VKTPKVLFLLIAVSSTCPGAGRAQSQIYNFVTLAGDPGYGSADGTNLAVRFRIPCAVAVDDAGNIYVADSGNSTIRKLALLGTNWVSSTIAGLAGHSGSADGTNSDARFQYPAGIAVDGVGNVYVVDASNDTIRKLTLVGTNWVTSTIAGLAGNSGSADGTNSDARFQYPAGIAVDSVGNVYVADASNDTVRKLTLVGTNWVTSTIAGLAGKWGSNDGVNSMARFAGPLGVTVDSRGNLYVADTDNSTIRKLTPKGSDWVTSTIVGLAGSSGSADGTNSDASFDYPSALTVDSSGNVYVADTWNGAIRKVTQVGTDWVTSTIAGLAGVSYEIVDGTNSDARFILPRGIAVSRKGDIYVADRRTNPYGFADNSTIRMLTPLGADWVTTTIAGDIAHGYGSNDGTNSTARFTSPSGAAVDSAGNLYVADNGNDTIRKLTPIGTNWVTSTIAGLAGNSGGNDGTNSDARFDGPSGVAVDSVGNVYVADSRNDTIRKLTPVGTNWVTSTIAGLAGKWGSDDGTNSDARFDGPSGVAVDSGGNLYVADNGNDTIRRLTPVGTNWVTSSIAGLAGSLGSADGTNTDARFGQPQSIAVDAAGNVYVADWPNATIRKLTPSGTNWESSTIAGRAGNYGTADGTNNDVQFSDWGDGPHGVALDGAGNLYVTDQGACTIRKLTPVWTNWVSSTIAGLAQSVGNADGTNSDARFFLPTGIVVDSAGNIYVADTLNHTIREGVAVAVALSPPVFQNVTLNNGLITLTWSAIPDRRYQLQYSSDLTPTAWQNLGNTTTATNGTISAGDAPEPVRQRFYRIVLLP